MDTLSLTVNGVELHQYAWNVENRGGRWKMPGKRGENFSMPGVHGSTKVGGKVYEENFLVFNMWAVGANPDGSMPADRDSARQCLENLDMLSRLFSAPTLDVRQTMADGSVRQCTAEVVQSIDFSSMAGGTRAEFGVELEVPAAFWFDLTEITQTIVSGITAPVTLSFTSFAPATAPVVGAVYAVQGPISSPVLTNPVTGQWVKLAQTLAAEQVWTLDTKNWTTRVGSTNALENTSHGLGTTFLDLSADPTGPKVVLTGGSTTAATSVQVTAKRAYFLA